MRSDLHTATGRTCDAYSRAASGGEQPSDIVRRLAEREGVQRPAIWRRLRAGGVLPPYNGASRIGVTNHHHYKAAVIDAPPLDPTQGDIDRRQAAKEGSEKLFNALMKYNARLKTEKRNG